MTLINASLLAGVLLAGLPVLLHLMMRAKPKRIEFPALRLLLTRQTANSRRMRVRHLLLLILRALLIAVAVMALVRPSLPAAHYGLRWYEWLLLIAVIAAAVGFYRWKSKQAAQEEPAEHLLRERRTKLRGRSVLLGVLLALLCVALPWGVRVNAELSAPRSPLSPDIPVAAVFIFDNSLSMTYKHEGQTRLEGASEMALAHLSVLPSQSQVAIVTTDPQSEVVFQADLAGARSRISALKTTAVPRTLNVVLKEAINAQIEGRQQAQEDSGGNDTYVREIYLLTDLSVAAWRIPDESAISDLLVQHEWLQIYLIDLRVDNPNNVALSQLRLDRDVTVADQEITISVSVAGTPAANQNVVLELFTLGEDGQEIRGGGIVGSPHRTLQLGGSAPTVTFSVKGLAGTDFTSGYIRLASPDPLTEDDVRFFTFGVSQTPRVLLVGDRYEDTSLLLHLLQPNVAGYEASKRFLCKAVTTAEFERETLANYDVICVQNWQHPSDASWTELKRFTADGGALLITVGGEYSLDTSAWTTTDSTELLPGIPLTPVRFRREAARISLNADDNPIVSSFQASPEAKTELNRAIFDRCWTFNQHADARVLMTFIHETNPQPALLERKVGSGRVLLFTSAMDNNGDDKWNEDFVVGENWSFTMLIDETMKYLTGVSQTKHNFTVGDTVEITVDASQRFSQYLVARPRIRQTKGMLPFDEPSVLLEDIDEAGQYAVKSADEGNSFHSDFSANIEDAESDLTPISEEHLNQILGEGRYAQVTDPETLDRAVNLGRLGIEVFPVLMGLLIMLFCAEHLMANFFYDTEPVSQETATTA
jgi:hypothetical protein